MANIVCFQFFHSRLLRKLIAIILYCRSLSHILLLKPKEVFPLLGVLGHVKSWSIGAEYFCKLGELLFPIEKVISITQGSQVADGSFAEAKPGTVSAIVR